LLYEKELKLIHSLADVLLTDSYMRHHLTLYRIHESDPVRTLKALAALFLEYETVEHTMVGGALVCAPERQKFWAKSGVKCRRCEMDAKLKAVNEALRS
jgi:hypothetical protein